MTGVRPAALQGAFLILGAVAMLGCWIVVLLELLQLAYLGRLAGTGISLLFLLGALAPALLATGLFIRAARDARESALILAGPLGMLAIGVASLMALAR